MARPKKKAQPRFIDATIETRHGPIVVRGYEDDYAEPSEVELLRLKLVVLEAGNAAIRSLLPKSRRNLRIAQVKRLAREPERRKGWTEEARGKIRDARARARAELAERVRRFDPSRTSTEIAEQLRAEGLRVSRHWVAEKRREPSR